MHADDDKAAIPIFRIELGDVRQRIDTIDAAIGPEIHQHHLAAQAGHAERRGIEPVADADEIWRGALRCGDREGGCRFACNNAAEVGTYRADQTKGNHRSRCSERSYRHRMSPLVANDYRPIWPAG